jgi:hypothetical protein
MHSVVALWGERRRRFCTFSTLTEDGVERPASRFRPEEMSFGANWTGDWVVSSADLDAEIKEKFLSLPETESR